MENKWTFNVLVIYYLNHFPLRQNTLDHLYCFQKHGNLRAHYLNSAIFDIPRYLSKIKFDLVIFDTTFCGLHWHREAFLKLTKRFTEIIHWNASKAVFPQDEFINTDLLGAFIEEFGVNYVFSVAPEAEWTKIYPAIDRRKVHFIRVLTGYLEDYTVDRINRLACSVQKRDTDIGYRAGALPWFGRWGMKKVWLGEMVTDRAQSLGIKTDINVQQKNESDRLIGDDWYSFLLKCKYTLGIEGGTSILDVDGTIRRKTEDYLLSNQSSSFEEIEKNCFPNRDGEFNLVALSPRHLEACATQTVQILVEGEYGGVLKANRHYIPLKKDFSNLDEILSRVQQNQDEHEMADLAYREIVVSRKYSYERFVNLIVATTINLEDVSKKRSSTFYENIIFKWMFFLDEVSKIALSFWTANRLFRKIGRFALLVVRK